MKIQLTICGLLIGLSLMAQNQIASAELEAQNVNEVKVEGSFCDVYVERGNRNYVKASIIGRGNEGDFEFDTDIIGSTLIVRVIRQNRSSWRSYNTTEAKIELTIKDGVSLDIDNSSGDVFVSDLNTSESKIEASSGDITLKRINANLEVETSSGDISIDGLEGDLEMESTSGDQEVSNLVGNLDTRASSGDITIEDFDGELDLEATSGDIELIGGRGVLYLKTTSGNIDGDDIELTGDSNLRASSGDIEIDFENPIDELSFDLTSSSGNLDVGNRSGEKKLYIRRGGITVIGVTSSGNQEYD